MSGPISLYMDFLAREGYRPSLNGNSLVVFKEEGRTYVIPVDTQDPAYFQLLFPNFWSIDDSSDFAKAILAANETTRITKVAKVYVRDDGKNVTAAIEMLLDRPEDFAPVFRRSLSAIKSAVKTFVEKM